MLESVIYEIVNTYLTNGNILWYADDKYVY